MYGSSEWITAILDVPDFWSRKIPNVLSNHYYGLAQLNIWASEDKGFEINIWKYIYIGSILFLRIYGTMVIEMINSFPNMYWLGHNNAFWRWIAIQQRKVMKCDVVTQKFHWTKRRLQSFQFRMRHGPLALVLQLLALKLAWCEYNIFNRAVLSWTSEFFEFLRNSFFCIWKYLETVHSTIKYENYLHISEQLLIHKIISNRLSIIGVFMECGNEHQIHHSDGKLSKIIRFDIIVC